MSLSRKAYIARAKKLSRFHKFGFSLSEKLTPARKGAISKKWKQLQAVKRGQKQKRIVFAPVKSRRTRDSAFKTGEVVKVTNRGVFVSVNQGQIEKTGMGKLKVRVRKGGVVSISYGAVRVESVAIDVKKYARNPAKYIAAEAKRRKARGVSVVIDGYEHRQSVSGPFAQSDLWVQYTNDLIAKIERDMLKADRRRTRKSVREQLSHTIAFRFYYGNKAQVETQSLSEFLKRHSPEDGEDLEDISEDEE